MKSRATYFIFGLLAFSTTARAQEAAVELGGRLFRQSCGVCHVKPILTANPYGPTLSKETLGGDAGAIADLIRLGTAKMPGFQYQFTKQQTDAIASYIKTVAPQSVAAPQQPTASTLQAE